MGAQHDDDRPDVPRFSAAKITERIAQVRRGEVVSARAVDAWLASWSQPDELPVPVPEPSGQTRARR